VLAAAELVQFGSLLLLVCTTKTCKKLPRLATGKNPGRLAEARDLWEERYLRLIRWCKVDWSGGDNPLVTAVPDVSDRPLAALATTIAPCHVWSDNYKHLKSVGVVPPNTPSSWRSLAQASNTVASATGITVAGLRATANRRGWLMPQRLVAPRVGLLARQRFEDEVSIDGWAIPVRRTVAG
jgi:hypothetical protein